MAFAVANGTAGRVRIGVGDTVVAGINRWVLDRSAAEIRVAHFENPANSDGIVHPDYVVGLGEGTVELEGQYDVGTITESGVGLRYGVAVSLDLLLTRTPFGYLNVAAFLTKFTVTHVFENAVATFRATARLTAAVGSAA